MNELLSLSQRFEVARMLREQKTYLEIAEKTGASTATISPRANRSLNYGNDGYDMVFERMENKRDEQSKVPGTKPGIFIVKDCFCLKKYRSIFQSSFF